MTDPTATEQKPPKVVKVADCYFHATFITELIKELNGKAFLVKTGLDTISKSDQFSYCVLQRLGYFEVEGFSTLLEDKNDD